MMQTLQTTVSADVLTERVADLIAANRLGAARPLLAALRRLAPPSPRIAELAAILAMREGQLDLARSELDTAVTASPEHAGLRRYRADLRQQIGDMEGALADAAEAVILDRQDPAGKALLGTLLLQCGQAGNAAVCLGEAVMASPADPAYREGFAAALEAGGDADSALATLTDGIHIAPGRVELRNAAILLSVRRRDFGTALRLAEEARVAGVADACSFGLMGHALSSLARHEEAADAYGEALKLGPNDPYVRHLVAASGTLPSARRAPVEYLRTVFDGYADRFELHLVSLGYRVPGLVRAALAEHPTLTAGGALGPVLDLGCGTGLLGLALSDLPVAPLVGVDVSARMLAHAEAKGLYAELREADLMQVLNDDTTHWQAILAGDVLCYFGALDEVLAAVHARLAPGGWFIFSVERLLPDINELVPGNGQWLLQRQGRYAHDEGYVAAAINESGFIIRRLEDQTLRFEANAAAPGIFAVLERTRHDG